MDQFKEFGMPAFRPATVDRQLGLKSLQKMRDDKTAVKMDWAYHAISMPPLDWSVIKIRYPELLSPDHEIKTKAWAKFITGPESEPYRVRHQKRGLI